MLSLLFNLLDRLFVDQPKAHRIEWLTEWEYAHRGLHGCIDDVMVLENSMPAFSQAIAHGYGIECDVQLSADGKAIVFHDYVLDRLTRDKGRVASRNAGELCGILLHGRNGSLCELNAMLGLVRGRAPILVEIKAQERDYAQLCRAVYNSLRFYDGDAAIMSFDPDIVRWFRKNAPEIIRGLVVTEENARSLRHNMQRRRHFRKTKPDFLAYDIRDLPAPFPSRQRARGVPILSWTIRSKAQHDIAAEYVDAKIFEEDTDRFQLDEEIAEILPDNMPDEESEDAV